MTTTNRNDADVIVLGAGMGGLCAAAYLVAAGYRVLLLEKSRHMGGRCSHRERDGFTVTTGAIMIPMGADSAIRQAFDAVGAPMDMIETTGRMRYRLQHGDYDLPPVGGGLRGMIEFAFEGDTAQTDNLFRAIVSVLGGERPDEQQSLREWLLQHTDNAAVLGLLQGFCAALMGTSLHEIPAAEFFRFLGRSSKGSRFGLAAAGNGELMETLAAGIESRGCEILRHQKVSRILMEGKRVTGVEVVNSKGETRQFNADAVISNLGPAITMDLCGQDEFDGPWRQRFEAHNHSAPIIHYSFVCDEPLIPDLHGSMVFGNTRNLIYLEIPSLISPQLAPEGKYLHTAYGAPMDATTTDLRADAANALNELEDNFPGVQGRAQFLVKARHTGPAPGMHRWPGYMMPNETPISGLFNVGDGATPPGTIGTEGSAASARAAVKSLQSMTHGNQP
jgi:phytoene dehydrogenase-like protein